MDNTVVADVPAARRTSMVSAASILMAGFVLSRLLGLLRISIQAHVLGGTSPEAVAFTAAIAIPDVVFTLVTGGALGSSFIPVFAGLLELGDEEKAWRVAVGVMTGVLLVMVVAVGVAELFAPSIVRLVAPAGDAALTTTLTRIMLLQPLFLALGGILMGLHNSYHRFVAPAVAPLIYNLSNIAGLLLIGVFHHAVSLAAWGVTVGAVLQVVVMLPGLRIYQRFIAPGLYLDDPGTREVGRLMVPRVIGQAGIQITALVSLALANLSYADHFGPLIRLSGNLMALPVGIFGGAVATAVFPTLAGQAARGELSALGATVSRTLRNILFLSIPAAVGLMVLRYPVIVVLYRGGRFSSHDVDLATAGLLLWGVGVPVLAAVELLPRVFFALKDTWTPVRVNLVTLATAIALSVIGTWLAHGNSLVGIALLTGVVSLTVFMEVAWLGLLLRRRLANLGLRDVGVSVLRSLAASGAMGVALLALLYLWRNYGPAGVSGNALLLLIAVPLGLLVYAGWSYVVEAPELAVAWAAVYARLARRMAARR